MKHATNHIHQRYVQAENRAKIQHLSLFQNFSIKNVQKRSCQLSLE
jgi:hypothetical protein